MDDRYTARLEGLYQRHKDEVILGRRTPEEVLAALAAFADLEEITDTSETFSCFLSNCGERGAPTPVRARSYRLLDTPRNQPYLTCLEEGEGPTLYVELDRGLCWAGSYRLSSAFRRLQGIDPADLAARGEAFADYVMGSFPDDPDNPLRDPLSTEGTPLFMEVDDR